MFDAGRKTDAEYAIEYIQENPEAGLCCEDQRWWITPNANETDSVGVSSPPLDPDHWIDSTMTSVNL